MSKVDVFVVADTDVIEGIPEPQFGGTPLMHRTQPAHMECDMEDWEEGVCGEGDDPLLSPSRMRSESY